MGDDRAIPVSASTSPSNDSVDLKDKWRVMMQADARKRADKDVQTEVDALAEAIMQIRDSSPKQTERGDVRGVAPVAGRR